MAGTKDYTWDQGADGEVSFIYKTGTTTATVTPVNLTGYTLRMDLSIDGTNPATDRIWTFNSADDAGPIPIDYPGAADNEATLGADGSVYVLVPRALSLTGGAIYTKMQAGIYNFKYDIFLRNPAGKQKKILEGRVTIVPSVTLWA